MLARPGDQRTQTLHARLGGEAFVLDVADTPLLREKGLSKREYLNRGTGMLFVFDKDDRYGFWMKDMQFPIDIAWLDSAYHIIDIKQGATPSSYPEIFLPLLPARYVVEAPAGFFTEHQVKIGDALEILR
ncbi:MAG: DUF192 domain-containing protein [Minisyncoccota bacterium]